MLILLLLWFDLVEGELWGCFLVVLIIGFGVVMM